MPAIYHITHIKNLTPILAQGGLFCPVRLTKEEVDHLNIAHQNIQERRALKKVPIAPFGVLHDYVPFYFAPRSPMLYTIERGNVEGYKDGQTPIIHLVSSAERVAQEKLEFVFTDGHGIMAFSQFFNTLAQLDQVDWKVMESKYWHDTVDDNDRKRRRNAEFLVYQFFPWTLIEEIGVMNQSIADKVQQTTAEQAHRPIVRIHREWYYESV
jgi:hypothetical protein